MTIPCSTAFNLDYMPGNNYNKMVVGNQNSGLSIAKVAEATCYVETEHNNKIYRSLKEYIAIPVVNCIAYVVRAIREKIEVLDKDKIYRDLEVTRFIVKTSGLQKNIEIQPKPISDIKTTNPVSFGVYTDEKNGTKLDVVVKKIKKLAENNDFCLSIFVDETRNLLETQNDDRFVNIIAAYETENDYVIVTKYSGITATKYLTEILNGEWSIIKESIPYFIKETAECLKALFKQRMRYEDFKYDNIVVSGSKSFKICDLGQSAVLGDTKYNGIIRYEKEKKPGPRCMLISIRAFEDSACAALLAELKKTESFSTKLNKIHTQKERQEIFEKYIKLELDKNTLIGEEFKDKISARFVSTTPEQMFTQFLSGVFLLYDRYEYIDSFTYEEDIQIMSSVIDGWNNYIQAQFI